MVTRYPILNGITPQDSRPTLLERHDFEFVEGLLAELGAAGGLAQVARQTMQPEAGSANLALYQPIHRVFHLVVLELHCSQFGEPRLDRARIESAGMVVRRVRPAPLHTGRMVAQTTPRALEVGRMPSAVETVVLEELDQPLETQPLEQAEAWMQTGPTFTGWLPLNPPALHLAHPGFTAADGMGADEDPDPTRRPTPLLTGYRLLDLMLAKTPQHTLTEQVAPLFIAPPEVTAATGRTLLFGVIPVSSSQVSEVDAAMLPFSDAELTDFLHPFLCAAPTQTMPRASEKLTFDAVYTVHPEPEPDLKLVGFLGLLRQVRMELNAFDTQSQASKRILAALNAIQLTFEQDDLSFALTVNSTYTRQAGDFLRDACTVLLEEQTVGDKKEDFIKMPLNWPAVTPEQAAELRAAVSAMLPEQMAKVAPRIGRYDDASAEYRLRAFVRVRREDDCPPLLVWSEYSAKFTIRPWHAPSPAAPMLIPLPEISADFLSKVRPNVGFIMPPRLNALLNNNRPDAYLNGSLQIPNMHMAMDMICGFNIPIITICAIVAMYIVLNILNLVFHWLPFVITCIPFPRRENSEPSP